jgi:hypothetical protein
MWQNTNWYSVTTNIINLVWFRGIAFRGEKYETIDSGNGFLEKQQEY